MSDTKETHSPWKKFDCLLSKICLYHLKKEYGCDSNKIREIKLKDNIFVHLWIKHWCFGSFSTSSMKWSYVKFYCKPLLICWWNSPFQNQMFWCAWYILKGTNTSCLCKMCPRSLAPIKKLKLWTLFIVEMNILEVVNGSVSIWNSGQVNYDSILVDASINKLSIRPDILFWQGSSWTNTWWASLLNYRGLIKSS